MESCQVRITTLSDNIAGEGFEAEWGFSLLIETEDSRLLFDTGASSLAVRNAHRAGINLAGIGMIVLSHGHYDHTGGLLAVLQATGPATIVAHPGVLEAKYALQPGEEKVLSIGLPFTRSSLEKEGATFHLSQEPLAISPCIMTSGEVPLASSFEKVDHSLLVEKGGVINQDPMADDQALIINTSAGLVIILGCAHHGVINTLIHACNLTGVSKILAVIGGMHLYRASEEQVRATLATLKSMKVERLVSSHCTGSAAAELLAKELGERFSLNSTGSKFLWP